MRFILLIAALGFVAGCSFEEAPELPGSSALKAYVDPKPEPNHYEVKLQWAVPETGPTWVVYREQEGSAPVTLATLPPTAHEYVDARVVSGTKYKYTLGASIDGGHSTVASTSLMIPKDMVVKDRQVLTANVSVGRLFLSREARLVTEGKDIAIAADEIISENGVVETFSDGATASVGASGRNGGYLSIKAKRGRGSLLVHARGENGAAGGPGSNGGNGMRGADGQYALSTHFPWNGGCGCGPRAHQLREEIRKGNGFARLFFDVERNNHRCIQQPGDGNTGQAGAPGNPGSPGGKGGNSARVYVEIVDATQLKVDVFLMPGKGGAGGAGGIGGRGGPGGNPGSSALDHYSNCRVAQAGRPGPNGTNGNPGLAGAAGMEEPICLRLGESKTPDCNKF